MTRKMPSIEVAKTLAKELCRASAATGQRLGHAQALEQIAQQHGFRDWNTYHAAAKRLKPDCFRVGARVKGEYLSHPFTATVLSVEERRPGWFYVVLNLDEAVDVVRSESFSNVRRQIRGLIGPKGHSSERTSDGRPHIKLDLES